MSLTTQNTIELKEVSLSYTGQQGQFQALNQINLTIQAGDFLCLVGPSGCGKSSLLKTIAGYLAPTTGHCYMNEEEITGTDWRRGVVFQSPTLYPWLTVAKNISYGPRVRKQPAAAVNQLTDFYLEQVELTDFAQHYPFELSGGMKQRVSLARALANQPEIILMDEPFSALDAITRVKMQTFLRKMWQKNQQTILLITHDIEEALTLGTKVAVMTKHSGQIQELIPLPYTQRILAEPDYHVEADPDFARHKRELLTIIS